ncbi:hypothetical protein KKB69_02000 [Patescibacteria group bacterium]|nr:hypothetical protein [Patescibacteria group bacterium]
MNKGLTIVETLVYIAVFTLAMGAVSGFIIYFYRGNFYIIQQAYAVNSARRGIETMTREIREITYSDSGAYPVVAAQEQSFIFYSDIDKDENVEKVRYFLEGTDFKKSEIQAVGDPPVYQDGEEIISVISDNVRNGVQLVFTYYNASSTEVADLSWITDIRLVKVNLVVNVEPNRAPGEFTLTSSAQIRNLKEE